MGCFVETISWQDFEQVDLRVGTIVTAEVFAEARRPAYILHVDFGPDIGVLKSSAQITDLYHAEGLVGQQVIGVVNFPPKQIGPIQSQCRLRVSHTLMAQSCLFSRNGPWKMA